MSQVDQVRVAADIVKIVGDYVKLRKAGANYVGLCPFHQEKTPSFAVHPVKQIFHCFGCGVGGDVFKFVMQIENLSFPEALRRVAEKVGVRLEERAGDETYDANTKLRAGLLKLHEVAAKFFAAQLAGTAEGRLARAYLADRGVTDETVGRFRFGYAPGDGQAVTRYLTDAGFEKEFLEKSGLVIFDAERQRFYDRFRRRIIFPIANETGRVVAFAGRALGDEQPKYLNSPETPIYTKSRLLYHLDRAAQAIRKLDYAILVEGYMDCIAVAVSGIENVVASCGTSLTEGQVRLLKRYSQRMVVNYDPDSAGMAATERSLALLLEEGFEVKVLALPGGLDPDSFIRKQGAGAYRERLASAPTYLDYLTDRAAAKHDVRTPEGKVAAANVVLPYLVKVPNPLLRAELAGRLAERLRLDERLLRDELRRAAAEKRAEVRVPVEATVVRASDAMKRLLRLCLEYQEIADVVMPVLEQTGAIKGRVGDEVLTRLWEARQRGKKLDVTSTEVALSEVERKVAIEALFMPVGALNAIGKSELSPCTKEFLGEKARDIGCVCTCPKCRADAAGSSLTTAQPEGQPPNERMPALAMAAMEAFKCVRALQVQWMQRELESLNRQYNEAAGKGDWARAREIDTVKSNLDRELRRLSGPEKNLPKDKRSEVYYI
jgi:DNA primase